MTRNPSADGLSIDREIDGVAHRFEQSLRRGEVVRIEELLLQHQRLGHGLLRELVWAEIEFHQSCGTPIDWQDYADRFPSEVDRLREASDVERANQSLETSENSLQESVVADTVIGSKAAIADQVLTPLNLTDFRIERSLGRGGQGEVHLAQQISLARHVAIKFVNSQKDDLQSIQRFVREARILAKAQHPQIVTIHGIGRTDHDQLFLVMEYVSGMDLARQLKSARPSIDDAVQSVIKIGQAIEHAHRQGVIHRDLKPSNVLWDEYRGPVVTDFGLAKDLRSIDQITLTEQMVGTPAYMAPEQADRRFGEVTEKTDLYGISALLFALLTGRAPYGPGSLAEVLQQVTSSAPPPDPCQLRPELPVSLGRICQKGLSKNPEHRFSSAQELVTTLKKWASGTLAEADIELAETVLNPLGQQETRRLKSGGRLGRYRLISELDSDQTRKIFHAEDDSGRRVLLKCLPAEWLTDRLRRFQFRQEVMLSSSVKHPCLAEMIDVGVVDQNEFLAIEYVDGISVAQAISKEGAFSESRAVAILQPIAEAIHLIHQAGIIYRDLRPQNVLLTEMGQPVLAEVRFSDELERNDNVTMAGIGSVTSQYVAPEILLGRTSNAVSDVYTLGATLFTMLTGEQPFNEATDILALLMQKNSGRLISDLRSQRSSISAPMLDVLEAALKPNPDQRISSAVEFAQRLKAVISPVLSPAPAPSGNPSTPDWNEPNLLHAVWDQLDPELQDAFSLAYNKKRRTGSMRISTKDLFEAMGRLGTGPLKQLVGSLPVGAMPEPMSSDVTIDRTLLKESPLLSDCVHDSLVQFQQLKQDAGKVAPVDLFVDVAKHGHGASVVRLREHGVDADAIERIVGKLGLRVIRREGIPSENLAANISRKETGASRIAIDDHVTSGHTPQNVDRSPSSDMNVIDAVKNGSRNDPESRRSVGSLPSWKFRKVVEVDNPARSIPDRAKRLWLLAVVGICLLIGIPMSRWLYLVFIG